MLAQMRNPYGLTAGQAAGSLRAGTAGAADGRTGDAADRRAAGSADGTAGGREYRIGELARAAGIPVRTLRYYQERKLLPPPRREGRIAWYSGEHLDRLRVIAQLLNRGHTLGGTAELLSAWERGYDLADLLGFERAVTAPWSHEVPVPVAVAEVADLIGDELTPEVLAEAVDLGYIKLDGDRVTHISRRLLDTTLALLREGIPLRSILTASRAVQACLDELAALFIRLVTEHVAERAGGPPRPHEVARLAETIQRLRPIARTVIDAEFGRAMDRQARITYDDFIRSVTAASGDGRGTRE
jgi:DNA-binding transcriptional MerR regulator